MQRISVHQASFIVVLHNKMTRLCFQWVNNSLLPRCSGFFVKIPVCLSSLYLTKQIIEILSFGLTKVSCNFVSNRLILSQFK